MWAAQLLDAVPAGPVLELCSGAGHIGLRAVVGLDAAARSASTRTPSRRRTRGERPGRAVSRDRVEVRTGWIEDVLRAGRAFPIVIADPPWVPRAETVASPRTRLLAIDGGDDGMDVVRTCINAIEEHLAPGGVALLQLGTTAQAAQVEQMLGESSGAWVRTVAAKYATLERGVVLPTDA